MKRLLFLALLLIAATSQAEIKKWVDKDGKVYYGEEPPVGVKAQPINIRPSSPPVPSGKEGDKTSTPTWQDKELEFRKRQKDAEEARKKADEKAKAEETRQRNCEQSRAMLNQLQYGGRQKRYNAKGESEFLDEAGLAAEIARAEKDVAQWCK